MTTSPAADNDDVPPGFEPAAFHRMPRNRRRAIWRAAKKALKLDCEFFDRHPTRWTRVRRAIEYEFPNIPAAERLYVVILHIRPGAQWSQYHKRLFAERSPRIALQQLEHEVEELALKFFRPASSDFDSQQKTALAQAWLFAGAPTEGRG
jgi:hypothetical protein